MRKLWIRNPSFPIIVPQQSPKTHLNFCFGPGCVGLTPSPCSISLAVTLPCDPASHTLSASTSSFILFMHSYYLTHSTMVHSSNPYAVNYFWELSILSCSSFQTLTITTLIYFISYTSNHNFHIFSYKHFLIKLSYIAYQNSNTLPFTHFLPNFSVTSYQNFHYLPFQQFLSKSIHFLSHVAYQNSHTLHYILRPVFIHFAIVVVASGVNHGHSWVTELAHLCSTFRYKSCGMMELDASSSGF